MNRNRKTDVNPEPKHVFVVFGLFSSRLQMLLSKETYFLQANKLFLINLSKMIVLKPFYCCSIDVNECEDPAVCGSARCENNVGGYDCLCEEGYVFDNESRSCVGKCINTHTHSRAHQVLMWLHVGSPEEKTNIFVVILLK